MAGSVRSCCVPCCGKNRADNTVLHSFPDPTKESERFILWVNAIGSSISSLDQDFIFKNRKICHDHFEEKFLTWTRRLAHGAIPTLRIPGSQGRAVRDTPNIASSDWSPPEASTSASALVGHLPSYVTAKSLIHSTTSISSVITPSKKLDDTSLVSTTVKVSSRDPKGALYPNDKTALIETLKKVTKEKDSYAIRLRNALKLSENTTFQNTLKKFTPMAAIFINMQFREIKKQKMGRRFTQKEKIVALYIYLQGPKCYKMLSKIFVLPSPLTLNRMISRPDLRAGVFKNFFNALKSKLKT